MGRDVVAAPFVATPWGEDAGVCLFCGTPIHPIFEERWIRANVHKRDANGEPMYAHSTHGLYGNANSRQTPGRPCMSVHVHTHLAELRALIKLGEQMAELVPVDSHAIDRTKEHLRRLQSDLEDP